MERRFRVSSFLFYGINGLAVVICIVSFINALSWINKPFPGFLIFKFSRVGSMSGIEWPGIQAGLKTMDRIVAVDKRSIREGSDVVAIVKEKPPGTLVDYTAESKGQIRKFTFPSAIFGFYDFFIVFLVPFLGGLALFCLGFIAFVLKPNISTSWAFLLSCLFVGIYMVTGFEIQSTYLLVYLHYLITPLIPASLFHLGSIFPEKKSFLIHHPKFEYLIYLPALVLAVLYELYIFTFLKVSPSHLLSWFPDYKDLADINRIFTPLCIVGMVMMILHSLFRTSLNIVRQRARMILFGATIAFLLPGLITFVVYFKKATLPLNLLVFFVIFFPASIAYSIVRHNLFDADTIIKRTVGYALMTALVGGTYFSIQMVVRKLVLQPLIGRYVGELYPVIFSFLIVFFFNPVRNRIQKTIDRIFYRLEYDYQETVQRISEALRSLLHLDEIGKSIIDHSVGVMFIESGSVMVLNPKEQVYESITEPSFQLKIPGEDPLIQMISTRKKEVTLYDIQEDPLFEKVREACKKTFEKLKATLIVPLIYEDSLTGLISLGDKKSGKFYRRDDINLLTTLANQGAVAIENARLFEENIEKSRMEEELKIAHDIQISMLPDKAPTLEGFSIAARSIPAREVGGDFYDFIEIKDNRTERLAIVVGDVSGKAVSGALVMAASRSIFRVLSETHESVEEVMNRGNIRLHQDVKKGMFVALLYAVLDPQKKTLTFSNAGQVQPILFSFEKSKPEYMDAEGDRFPLGIIKDCHYEENRIPLKHGDFLVFYTDGMVEAVNDKGELYGFERFLTSIEEGRELGADELLGKLINDVMQYVGKVEQHDDLTTVVVKVE